MKSLELFIAIILISNFSYALTGNELLKKMDAVRDYKTAKMDAVMKIVNRNGDETTMKLTSYEMTEGDKSLMRFTFPGRLKGTAILTNDDNIWYYNKRTGRVRLLSKSAKQGSMMGSSFSYDDMSQDWEKDFLAEILKDNTDEYVLKVLPKDKDKKYKFINVYVDKNTYVAKKMEYYNKSEIKYKEMLAENIIKVKGHILPMKITMEELSSGKVTIFEINKDTVGYDLSLEKTIFSERNLKR